MKHLTAAIFALSLIAPMAAIAQDVPSYAQSAPADEQIHGRIASFDGGYNLSVRDERGFVDNVTLHEGTIINPTGLTLAPGMVVSILGYNAGSYFAANEIDTPYSFYDGVPYYDSHPWFYYGPTIGLGFFFGNVGWWHGDYFHGEPRYYGGARVYTGVHINNVYYQHAGGFRGRDFVAPGGYHAGGHIEMHGGGGGHGHGH